MEGKREGKGGRGREGGRGEGEGERWYWMYMYISVSSLSPEHTSDSRQMPTIALESGTLCLLLSPITPRLHHLTLHWRLCGFHSVHEGFSISILCNISNVENAL